MLKKIMLVMVFGVFAVSSQGASIGTINAQVGGFFFTNIWSGTCDMAGGGAGCNEDDPAYDGVSAFVPITSVDDSGLVVTAGQISGVVLVDAFSPTFGVPLGTITFDFDAGLFSLVGALGNASGTVSIDMAGIISGSVTATDGTVGVLLGALPLPFTGSATVVPVPAAAWLLGSALLGLFGVRRRS